jgi:hypothetical protein
MIGLLWNIRGLGKPGRVPTLISKIRENHADFVGVIETKKENFTHGFLRSFLDTFLLIGVISLLKVQQGVSF